MSKSKPSGNKRPLRSPSEPNPHSATWLRIYDDLRDWAAIICRDVDSRDILQDVYVAVNGIDPIRIKDPVAYFKTMLKNRYFAEIKKTTKQPTMVSTGIGTYHITDIDDVLSDVDEFDRELFKLHYIHGVPVVLICRQIAVPTPTIYASIHRVVAIVKAKLS